MRRIFFLIAIQAVCFIAEGQTVSVATTNMPNNVKLPQCSVTQVIAVYNLGVTGSQNAVLSSFTVSVNAGVTGFTTSEIKDFKLWQSTTKSVSGTTPLATISAWKVNTPMTFSGFSASFPHGSTKYLIVTADVSCFARIGDWVQVKQIGNAGAGLPSSNYFVFTPKVSLVQPSNVASGYQCFISAKK